MSYAPEEIVRLCNKQWYSETRERYVKCILKEHHTGYCYSGDY